MLTSVADVVVLDEAFEPSVVNTEVVIDAVYLTVTSAKCGQFVESLAREFRLGVVAFHWLFFHSVVILARLGARVKGVRGTVHRTPTVPSAAGVGDKIPVMISPDEDVIGLAQFGIKP